MAWRRGLARAKLDGGAMLRFRRGEREREKAERARESERVREEAQCCLCLQGVLDHGHGPDVSVRLPGGTRGLWPVKAD